MQIRDSLIIPRRRLTPGLGIGLLSLIALLLLVPYLGRLLTSTAEPISTAPDVTSVLNQLPLAFVPDQGPGDAVRFETRGSGSSAVFTPQEVTLNVQGQTLQLNFVGANPAPTVAAGTPLPGKINDFRGRDADNWLVGQPTYAGVEYQQLYPGINLQYEGVEGVLKSTFSVAPGANPAAIRWQYSGAEAIAIDDATGDLHITLPDQSKVVEQAPVAWQDVNGRRQPVSVAYTLLGKGSVGFALGSYDAGAPLTIDPTIVYETTTSLAEFDSGRDIAVDADGNAYVVGRAYDTNNDVFIAKLSPNGTLLYTTYLRGSRLDHSRGITLDGSGGVYIAGLTDSTDFPILNAMQPNKKTYHRSRAPFYSAPISAAIVLILYLTSLSTAPVKSIWSVTRIPRTSPQSTPYKAD